LLDSTLGIIASLFCFIGFVSGSLAIISMRKPTKKSMMVASQMAPIISTAARELETVRVFNAGPFLNRVWLQCQEEFNHLKYFLVARQGLIQSIVQTSVALTGVAIISVGAILVVKGELDVGALIGANILAARALQPIYRFTQLVESFVTAQESIQILGEIAMLPKESREGSAKRNYSGGLIFRDLAFSYPGSKSPLFESLSLEIKPGQAILGFGANSTGKTTLARLIAGLLEPSRGEILGDGLNLRQVSPEWWRKQIIYLPQETVLINGTIQENICIANQDMGEREAQQLVDRIGLREFVDTSKDGIRTAITDNGRQLAVGTRRRLAFARALATDGPLVILDEPTEGFDPAGTKLVNSVVTELSRQGRTIIAFTHDSTSTKGTHLAIDLNEKPIPKIIKQDGDVK
ncbi:MAG: ATP-binding cassette domain-containing protein, partial [Pseudomonadota bacterium]|nr:ATP-binding cassette domain-containing protein [Pseudomonadota bacterium]